MTIRVVGFVVISKCPSKLFYESSFRKCVVYHKSANYIRTIYTANHASFELIFVEFFEILLDLLNMYMYFSLLYICTSLYTEFIGKILTCIYCVLDYTELHTVEIG